MANYRFNGVSLIQYNDYLLTDITNNLTVDVSPDNIYFVEYIIQDGDTPENIAYRLWSDSSLSWVLCLVNNVIDQFFDWPLRSDELMAYVKNKYGELNVYAPHHYERDGYVVNKDPDDNQQIMVTNYAYEFAKNEEKRSIHIPTEEFMQAFLNQWSQL